MKNRVLASSAQKELAVLPAFEQRGHQFVVMLWRDWLTADRLAGLELNDRQREALMDLKVAGEIGHTAYQSLVGVSKCTAHRDLTDLIHKGLLERLGTTGKGTGYVLRKGAQKGPNGPSAATRAKGAVKGSKRPLAPEPATKTGGKK